MRVKRGKIVTITLLDGTTLSGEVRKFGFWGAIILENSSVFHRTGPEELAGAVIIPRKNVLVLQREG